MTVLLRELERRHALPRQRVASRACLQQRRGHARPAVLGRLVQRRPLVRRIARAGLGLGSEQRPRQLDLAVDRGTVQRRAAPAGLLVARVGSVREEQHDGRDTVVQSGEVQGGQPVFVLRVH